MKRKPCIWIYRDAAGAWRWRLKAANGRVIADSGEGYGDRRGALRATDALRRALPAAVLRLV